LDVDVELRRVGRHLYSYLRSQRIPCAVGRHKIPLSKRAISDLLEKYCVDGLMGMGNPIEYKAKTAYDVVIRLTGRTIYINIKKDDEAAACFNVTWISSKSVIDRVMGDPAIAGNLYYIKITYKMGREYLKVTGVYLAGPLTSLRLIAFDRREKGSIPSGYRVPLFYNGAHYFLPDSSFTLLAPFRPTLR